MDERIGYLVKRLQVAIRATMDDALRAKGLTTSQYSALSGLHREANLSNAELARRSFVTPQTMFRILENLEKAGLVARQPHPTHGKIQTVALTPKGAEVVASCHGLVAAIERQMLGDLSGADQQAMRTFLKRCIAALGEVPPGEEDSA